MDGNGGCDAAKKVDAFLKDERAGDSHQGDVLVKDEVWDDHGEYSLRVDDVCGAYDAQVVEHPVLDSKMNAKVHTNSEVQACLFNYLNLFFYYCNPQIATKMLEMDHKMWFLPLKLFYL